MPHQSGKSNLKKWFFILISIIILLFLLITGAWYYGAWRIETVIAQHKTRLADNGIIAQCSDQKVKGYPFRIGLFCSSVSYADKQNNIVVSGSAIRSAAQLYRPGHVVGEADGPLKLSLPGLAPMELNWQKLRASGRGNLDGLRRISLVSEAATISADDFGKLDLLATTDQLQVHLLAGDEASSASSADLDTNIRFVGWQIDDGNSDTIPKADLQINGLVVQGAAMLVSGMDIGSLVRKYGVEIKRATIEFATHKGGRLQISGPIDIDQRGLISGEVTIDIDDPSKLVDYGASIFPPFRAMTGNIVGYLDAFASSNGDRKEIRGLKLTIKQGQVLLGFIQIGQIPPLLLN